MVPLRSDSYGAIVARRGPVAADIGAGLPTTPHIVRRHPVVGAARSRIKGDVDAEELTDRYVKALLSALTGSYGDKCGIVSDTLGHNGFRFRTSSGVSSNCPAGRAGPIHRRPRAASNAIGGAWPLAEPVAPLPQSR